MIMKPVYFGITIFALSFVCPPIQATETNKNGLDEAYQSEIYPIHLTSESKTPPPVDLSYFKELYKKGNFRAVIKEGEAYLQQYPKDFDVRLFVALSYQRLKQYRLARKNYQLILNEYPNYEDARIALKKVDKEEEQHQKDLGFVNNDSKVTPKNNDLRLAKVKRNKQQHPIKSVRKKQSKPMAAPEKSTALRDLPHFNLGAYTSIISVNEPNEYWNASSYYLYRKNEYGSYGGAINTAHRNGMDGTQLFLNPQPKINKDIWLDLAYGYGNNPNIFPDQLWGGEIYGSITKTVELSGGNTYKKIQKTYFNTITGSITKYVGNYYFLFRPLHFVPKNGPRSTLYTVKVRRYTDTPDQFIGVLFSTGTSPDLFDLETVNFFKVKNTIFLLEAQQPINDHVSFQCGGGFESQKFPNGFIRHLSYLNLGIKLLVI